MYLVEGCSLLLKVQKPLIPFVLNTNLNVNHLFPEATTNQAEIKESDVVKRLRQESCVPLALHFFKSVANSNLFKHTPLTFEVMIRKLAMDGQVDSVQYLLQQMKLQGFHCSEDLFISVISVYRQVGLAERAVEMFYRIKEFGCDPSVKIYNHVLDTLLGENRIQMIYTVYRDMKRDGFEPNVFTYNVLLKALCKNNKVDGAKKLLVEMSNKGCCPDAVSYTTVISSMCEFGMVKEGRELAEKFEPVVSVYNALINGLCKDHDYEGAFDLMREMVEKGITPNVISYSTLINVLCNSGQIELAFSLLAQMLKRGCHPNIHTLSSLVKGCFVRGTAVDALDLWNRMIRGFELQPNVVAFNTLVQGFCSHGDMQKAMSVFSHMEENRCSPNIRTYGSLINGFAKRGSLEGAVYIWNKMLTSGCSPNVVVYTNMVEALCRCSKFKEAESLIEIMSKENCAPSVPTFNAFIKGLCDAGRLDWAEKVFRQMEQQYECPPNIVTYNELLDGLAKANRIEEAYGLTREIFMRGLEWSLSTYNTLLHGSCNAGLPGIALQLVGKMMVDGKSPDEITMNMILLAYCKQGKAERAVQMLDLVSCGRRKWRPDVISYTNVLWGLCSSNCREDAVILLERMISEGIVPSIATWNVLVRCFILDDILSP
ncbi:PREDICTED: pentatricopeptide repeat-containing protein At3g48810-like [Camelina sativa]|uniref:Pentatricopeptide repeat-containing protein At3g48810-like n=1 Tax=Camelina sativa TaxID=90675 RepID=A0ABM0TH74_CAMSA|nr:PREDICTED: pentatricopeptide repeat-containing protein At3g48810-like [Camelina sativa]